MQSVKLHKPAQLFGQDVQIENAEAEDVDIVPLLFARSDGRAHLGLLELVVGYLHALY